VKGGGGGIETLAKRQGSSKAGPGRGVKNIFRSQQVREVLGSTKTKKEKNEGKKEEYEKKKIKRGGVRKLPSGRNRLGVGEKGGGGGERKKEKRSRDEWHKSGAQDVNRAMKKAGEKTKTNTRTEKEKNRDRAAYHAHAYWARNTGKGWEHDVPQRKRGHGHRGRNSQNRGPRE